MPTSSIFDVFYLGDLALVDSIEGNTIAEDASALVGMTYGTPADPLVNNIETIRDWDVSGPNAGDNQVYKQDQNLHDDTFRNLTTNTVQNFDAAVQYNATITYLDGTTTAFTATIFQDDTGKTYLVPPATAGSDLDALEAGPIRSVTFDSIASNDMYGTAKSRQAGDFAVCFVAGTLISTPTGECKVEDLRVGDTVITIDNDTQIIRWIGQRSCIARGKHAPVRIKSGAFGHGLPQSDLFVSQQHRLLLSSMAVSRVVGQEEVIAPAKVLTLLPEIKIAEDQSSIRYFHLLFDRHELVLANGLPAEFFYLGPMAKEALRFAQKMELHSLLGTKFENVQPLVRQVLAGKAKHNVLRRHAKNGQPLLQTFVRVSARLPFANTP